MQETATLGTPVKFANGKEYKLRYPFKAVRQIKGKFGQSLHDMLKETDKQSVEDILAFALPLGNPEITEESLDDLLDGPTIPDVFEGFVKSFFGRDENEFWDTTKRAREAALKAIDAKTERVMADAISETAQKIPTSNG